MADTTGRKYVDHPAPSVTLVVLFLFTILFALVMIPLFYESYHGTPPVRAWVPLVAVIGFIGFYFWPIYTTSYTISAEGIEVRYGPWKRSYPWSDFVAAYWQKGMFATRIGWPSVTPCVRMTNAVRLKRPRWFDLYLTPNDPRAFLQKISELAPQLTAEAIL